MCEPVTGVGNSVLFSIWVVEKNLGRLILFCVTEWRVLSASALGYVSSDALSVVYRWLVSLFNPSAVSADDVS